MLSRGRTPRPPSSCGAGALRAGLWSGIASLQVHPGPKSAGMDEKWPVWMATMRAAGKVSGQKADGRIAAIFTRSLVYEQLRF